MKRRVKPTSCYRMEPGNDCRRFQKCLSNGFVCRLLNEIILCLTNATMGCTALMDVTEQRLNSINANNASATCSVSQFLGPTTSAPLAIYSIITVPTTTTTAAAQIAIIIEGMSISEQAVGQCSRICILHFFQISTKHEFLGFF